MNVTPLPSQKNINKSDSPYQLTMREFVANELVFGVVGPVGSGTSQIAAQLISLLETEGFDTTILKARDVIQKASERLGIFIEPEPGLDQSVSLQNAGDKLREKSGDNAAVAVGLIKEIRALRAKKQDKEAAPDEAVEPDGKKRAYILDSLRHPQEVALLRKVYQESFCLIGVFCHGSERLKRLSNEKYKSASKTDIEAFIDRDENAPESHGQKVSDTFHLSDYFINNTKPRILTPGQKPEENTDWDVPEQLGRLLDILTHKKIVRPHPNETGMFQAYGAKMQSSCLSRQVGAALVDQQGLVISTGTNEVPRAGGGVYGRGIGIDSSSNPEPKDDFRCFRHNEYCSNVREQNNIIQDLFDTIPEFNNIDLNSDLKKRLRKTRLGQLIEFSRAVHAEMDALLSAARNGVSTVGTHLYVTTFPCHNCARHIVSAGVIEVQYIEPYLKSKATELHGDSITTDPDKWTNPIAETIEDGLSRKVLFRPFIGVAPRLYRRAFFKDRDLKDNQEGNMKQNFGSSEGHGSIDTLRVSYAKIEAILSEQEPRY